MFRSSAHLLLPLGFFLIIGLTAPWIEVFGFDADEGINVMKAFLLNHNYSLYSEIWSDQPPLFTYWLAGFFDIFSPHIFTARLSVLFLSSLLIWGIWFFTQMATHDKRTAFIAVLIMCLQPDFLKLSISVMVGLPALSFAMLAFVMVVLWHRQQKFYWLILSAIFLSLSIFTKLFTIILAPILVLGIFIHSFYQYQKTSYIHSLITSNMLWLMSFIISSVFLLISLVGIDNITQLIEPHLSARNQENFDVGDEYTLNHLIKHFIPSVILAGIGFIWIFIKRQYLLLYPFAWLIIGMIALAMHYPVWYHHGLLLSIPMSILVAFAIKEGMSRLIFIKQGIINLLVSIVTGLLLITLFWVQGESLHILSGHSIKNTMHLLLDKELPEAKKRMQIAERLKEYNQAGDWIITDYPLYAFRAQLLVPPEIAVLSVKRKLTNHISQKQVINLVKKYQPNQVLLMRFKWSKLKPFLEKHYQSYALENPGGVLYIRKYLVLQEK